MIPKEIKYNLHYDVEDTYYARFDTRRYHRVRETYF